MSATRAQPGDAAATPGGEGATRAQPGSNATRSIPGAGGGGGAGDAFVTKCQDAGTLYGLWSLRDLSTGSVNDGDSVMTDLSGNGRPDLVAELVSGGNWKITEDGDSADPALASLQRYIEIDTGNQGTTNHAAMASAFGSVPVAAGEPFSGFVVYYAPSITSTKAEILSLTGTVSAPAGDSDAFSLFNQFIWYGPNTHFGYTAADPADLTGSGSTNDDRSGTWWFMAFRAEDTDDDDDVDDITVYIQDLGSAWATNQTTFTFSNAGLFATKCITETGLRIAYASGAALAGDYRYAAIALFTSDIGVGASGSTLRTIFEEIA